MKNGNPTSVRVDCYNLSAACFSRDYKGDIIGLIQEHNGMDFHDVIDFCNDILGLYNEDGGKAQAIFGGKYKGLKKYKDLPQENVEIYNEEDIITYANLPNMRFWWDYIYPSTQKEFEIGYDYYTKRITVPWKNEKGEIVGVTGRFNGEIDDETPKWKTIIPFSKSRFLYGLFQNKKYIEEKGVLYIGESEKFVMQLHSMGIRLAVSLGGCSISQTQASIIKGLKVSKVILCLDEGLEEEYIKRQCKKLDKNSFKDKEIFYIFDEDNKILIKGSKDAPSDVGEKKFKRLLKECLRKG